MSNATTLMTAQRNMRKVKVMKNYLMKHRDQDPEYTDRVLKSYSRVQKRTVRYTLLCVALLIVSVVVGIMKVSEYPASFTRSARVDGDKIWYVQSTKQELSLSDYGYDANDYEDGHHFVVVLDFDGKVVKIADVKEQKTTQTLGAFLMVGGMVVCTIAIILIYWLGTKTYGKEWYEFTKWYASKIGY